MKELVLGLASVAIMSAVVPAHAVGVQQAFLIQNSGWMEPFYTDTSSQFKPLVAAVAQAVTSADDQVFLLAFSQTSGDNVSPKLLSQNKGAVDMARQLAPLGVAHKGAGTALADTDFQEAITKTITGPFKSTPGILWIFTNNKNSPGNDPATAARNGDFYRLLHLEPSIVKTLVFPLKMPVQGKIYEAKGMMVYALAYGQPAAEALNRILKEGRLSKVLTNPPARLKPVDLDALRIVPESVKNTPNVRTSLGSDQRTLILDVDAANLVPTVVLQASLQNLFFPYLIQRANVEATLNLPGGTLPVQVVPSAIENLRPGERQAVEVQFKLPMEQVPSIWSMQAMSAMGKQVLLPMSVDLGLGSQQLALDDNFKTELKELFPGDPISEIFTPPTSVHTSQARVPVLVRIQYPLLPVLLAMGGLLAMVGGLAVFGLMSGRNKRYTLNVDGVPRNVLLKSFAALEIKDENGLPVGQIRRGLGQPKIVSVVDGHTLNLG